MLRRPTDQGTDLHLLTSWIAAASSQSTRATLFELIEAIGERRVPVVFDPGLAKKPVGVGAGLRHMLPGRSANLAMEKGERCWLGSVSLPTSSASATLPYSSLSSGRKQSARGSISSQSLTSKTPATCASSLAVVKYVRAPATSSWSRDQPAIRIQSSLVASFKVSLSASKVSASSVTDPIP